VKYFAYGSNMDPVRMRIRCPGATSLGPALLRDHRLTFRRWLAWRTGIGHVERAHGESVWGVLWEIDDGHERRLDRYEAVGRGLYTREFVQVEHSGSLVESLIYLATPEGYKRPSRRYLALLVRGAKHHGLPADYQAALRGLSDR
jgi:gamma-glutamylcyclotransferase (GGCT)/AIG2-like uncharacterized protein YtfP